MNCFLGNCLVTRQRKYLSKAKIKNNCLKCTFSRLKKKSCLNKHKASVSYTVITKFGRAIWAWGSFNCPPWSWKTSYSILIWLENYLQDSKSFCSALPQLSLSASTTVILITFKVSLVHIWSNTECEHAWFVDLIYTHKVLTCWSMGNGSLILSSNYKGHWAHSRYSISEIDRTDMISRMCFTFLKWPLEN